MTPTTPQTPRPQPAQEREGAAMLVTMMVLLVATAAGMFGVHAASFEIRASGAQRQRLQAMYVGENGLVAARTHVDGRVSQISHAYDSQPAPLPMAPYEPELAPNKGAYRIDLGHFAEPPMDQESVGVHSTHEPFLIVDITDKHRPPQPRAGEAQPPLLKNVRWTFTARGRLQVRDTADVVVTGRQFHEGASDARAQLISGPE